MEARITSYDGGVYTLPPLLSWDLRHGFCGSCDSFAVSFIYEAAMLPPLKAAVGFTAFHEGKTVFTGVVDEFEASADASGCLCTLRGRGMQALLLDNQAEAAEYQGADTAYILARHVRPWGVERIDVGALSSARGDLTVSSGDSQWSAVKKFMEFCAGAKPRFAPDGTLVLDGKKGGAALEIGAKTPLYAQTYTQQRYGVISAVTVKNRVAGTSVTVENAAFLAQGGAARRVVNVPRRTLYDAMRHTGSYQIAASMEEFVQCTLTLPALFAAFPGDRASLGGTPLGVSGDFLVWSSRCWADGSGAGTALELVEG